MVASSDYLPATQESPARFAAPVTPSDGTDLVTPTRAIMAGADGDVSMIFAGQSSAVTIPVTAGQIYPFAVKRIRATGTTATNIIALW